MIFKIRLDLFKKKKKIRLDRLVKSIQFKISFDIRSDIFLKRVIKNPWLPNQNWCKSTIWQTLQFIYFYFM